MREKGGVAMGQCGCGDTHIDKGYRLPDGTIVAYDIYHGCRDCNPGPGISIYVYPNQEAGRMWLDGAKIESYTPSEFGGNDGRGISFGLFEVQDMVAEANEIVSKDSGEIGPEEGQYATLQDWLMDFGLLLIQGAMGRYRARMLARKKARRRKTKGKK